MHRNWRGTVGLLAVLCALGLHGETATADAPYGHGTGGHRASATGHGHGHGHMGTGHYLRHLLHHGEAIGLTDEQTRKLKDIQLEFDRTRIRTEAEILVTERELSGLVQDEKTALSEIEAKLKQQETLETSLRLAAIKARRDAMALLNPDQRKKEQVEHERMMRSHRGESKHGGRGHDRMQGHTDGEAHRSSETRPETTTKEGER